MPDIDRIEILLQECAILRREIAHILGTLDNLRESSEVANAAVLERMEAMLSMIRSIEMRLPPLSQ